MDHALSKQDIVSAYFRLCRLQFGDNSYQPKLDHTFEYLKFDDLDIKGLIMSCEEVFGVDMGDPLAERPNINNLHGIFNVLMDKLVASGQFVPKRRRRPEEFDEGTGKEDTDDGLTPEAEDGISEAPADESEAPDNPDSPDIDPEDGDQNDHPDLCDSEDTMPPVALPDPPKEEDSEKLPDPPAEIDLGNNLGFEPDSEPEDPGNGLEPAEAENP